MMDLRTGDRVRLTSDGKWYIVQRKPYQYINGYTSSGTALYSDWMFVGSPDYDDGIGWDKRQIQVSAIGEVWRDGVQVWPPVAEQLPLFGGV
jgi:hypothetical protein